MAGQDLAELNPNQKFLSIEKASDRVFQFSNFPKIEELWILSKKSYHIPESINQLEHLKKLIVGQNCFLPKNIDELHSLRELWIHDEIYKVPSALIRSSSIKELHLSYFDKDIDPCDFPEWVYDMNSLEILILSVGRYAMIKNKINQLIHLRELDFGCALSDLKIFPDLSGLKSLRVLKVRSQAVQGQKLPNFSLFQQILESIKSLCLLESLDLSGWNPKKKEDWLITVNGKHSIPDLFDQFQNLNELSLMKMKLDFLPATVKRLKNLSHLDIRKNNISREEIEEIIQVLPNCQISSDVMQYKPRMKS